MHVQVVGVLGSDQYPAEEGFVKFPGHEALISVYPEPFLMEDYAISKLFAESQMWFERLAAKVSIVPDVIEVVINRPGETWVELNLDADKTAEMRVVLNGKVTLTAGDFLL